MTQLQGMKTELVARLDWCGSAKGPIVGLEFASSGLQPAIAASCRHEAPLCAQPASQLGFT